VGAIKPITNDHSGDWHLDRFAEFAVAKAAIGEPVPHMRVVDWMCRDVGNWEALWRAGCYLAGYSVITGEGIWRSWSWEEMKKSGERFLTDWVDQNWGGFHTRVPRRCVRTPAAFARCLLSFAQWMRTDFDRLREESENRWELTKRSGYEPGSTEYQATNDTEYQEWWRSAERIDFYGRYLAIRLLELSRRRGYMRADLYDIRAVGAHSPIRCLMLLRPDAVPGLLTGEPRYADAVAEEVKQELARRGSPMSYFIYATLLCEYRGCYEDGHDYAGNQHDEELEYSLGRHADFWRQKYGRESDLYAARAAIDPHECLGEIAGWRRRRVRDEDGVMNVAGLLRREGVVWSDVRHDYVASVAAGRVVSRS